MGSEQGNSTGETPLESPAMNIIRPSLSRTPEDSRPVVVMTCGIAGAGKSTLAKNIVRELPNFVRLSADGEVFKKYGLFAIDYPAEKYEEYLDEAADLVRNELVRLLRDEPDKDIVLDLSFWNKEYRDEYKALVDAAKARWVLVFLEADKETLWGRIQSRRAKRDGAALGTAERNGDSAYDISEEVFEMYWGGFERPEGEGEIVVQAA